MRRMLTVLALIVTTTPLAAQSDRAVLTRRLDSLSRAWLAIGPSAGVSYAVVRGSDTLLLGALGQRDYEGALPATNATVYRTGSITKQFTAAAIMQLVEQGRIALDDPMTKYLPEYPQWRTITVRQLLNHTSGIHSYTANPAWPATWGSDLTPAQLVAYVDKDTLDFAPGTQFRYNNTGYVLLGMILDKVTGTPYPTLMRERFFTPLGMRSATYCPSTPTKTDDAKGYDRGATAITSAKYMSMTHPYSAGALCMSVVDFLRWQTALTSGRVVSPASYTMMSTSDTVSSGKPTTFGFGLATALLGTHRIVQHGGGVNGFNTAQMWFPDDSLRVVVFSNTVGSNPGLLAMTLASAVLGVPMPVPARAGAAPPAPQQRTVSIESLLSAPFPSSMSAAPAGGSVAWVQNDRGMRNVWVAFPPAYQGRQRTSFTADDGQEIGGIEWTPDGKTLFFVRGGGANRAGEVPNPTSDPAAAEQAIWRVPIADGAAVRVTQGSGVAISPRGDAFAFTRRGQIWSAPIDGSREPSQLANLRGSSSLGRWSPDGSKLVFTSNRGDHAFVGVLDPASKTVKWLAPSVDRDGQPVWSPDGARVAFLRMPTSSQLTLFKPVRSARPWSIMMADVATGSAKTVWAAERGMGSAYRNVVGDQLMWGAGDRIVFPWERTGWTSLYSVPVSGGTATLLTPGAFEVEYVSLSPDRTQVVYNSNQGDIDRRDVWRVAVGGGAAPMAVTTGSDIEWEPALTSNGAMVFFSAGARKPARAMIAVANAAPRELAPGTIPADFPERAMVEPQAVIFTSPDGMKIHAQLFLPTGAGSGEKRPAAIFFHGGSRRQMLLGWNYGSYYNNAYAFNQLLASKGYVVLSVNYRSGIGYGMEFREALNYGASGASEYNDVVGAGRFLASRSDVDARRIGLWGGSYGGFLTAMGLARNSNMFAAGVDFHGVHDWNVGIRTFVPSYSTLENPRDSLLAFRSSPLASLKTWRSPVLVIHGDDDRNVSFAETVTLVEQLRDQGVEVEQLVLPDEVHGFLRHSSWVQAYNTASDYLDRKLGVKGNAALAGRP